MEMPAEVPCSECGGKPAVYHLHVIRDGVSDARRLCEACFRSAAPAMAPMKGGRCRHCGGEARAGGGPLDAILGRNEWIFLCFSCSGEYLRFLGGRLKDPGHAGDLPVSAQLECLRAIDAEADAHMKRWVIQRDN